MNGFFIEKVEAMCPACTIAVGSGVGILRAFGVDDTITGAWIGGLIVSSGLWLADFIRKKQWRIPFPQVLSIFLMILFIIPPLYWLKMIEEKIITGSIAGSLIFLLGVAVDKFLRTINNNKVFVYYQKVIVPVLLLSITSLILFFIL